jgi:hypothetical protein
VGTIAGIVISCLLGVALGTVATVAIVQTNSPDKAVEQTIENDDSQQIRTEDIIEYGQR